MKKLLMFFTISLLVLTLTSCQDNNKIKTGFFKFELINLENEKLIDKSIKYNNESIFESLKNNLEVDYNEYDLGIFINGVEGFYPKEYQVTYNYYYSIYVNSELSSSGINEIDFKENLTISLREVTTLNKLDLKVDNVIRTLIKDIDVNLEIDYMLFASLVHANQYKYNLINLDNYQFDLDFSSIASSLKSLIYNEIANKNILEQDFEKLFNFKLDAQWDFTNYLNLLNVLGSYQEIQLKLAKELIKEDLYLDSDTAAVLLMNLSSLKTDKEISNYISYLLTYLKDEVTDLGVKGFGGENLSSTAQTLIGLMANGLKSNALNNIDLVEVILKYYDEGGFKYKLDGDIDLMFSTPQALASLIIYKIQRDQLTYSQDKSLNIFRFNYES